MRSRRAVLLLAPLAAAVLVSPTPVQASPDAEEVTVSDWRMFREDAAHRGTNVVDASMTTSAARTLTRVWTASVGGGYSSPAVVDGTLYSAALQEIVAIDAATGALRWRYDTGGWTDAAPAVAGGRVFAAAGRDLVALAAGSGAVLWSFDLGGTESPPTVRYDTVYVGGDDGAVHALVDRTGRLRWQYRTGARVIASPAVAGGLVVVPSTDGSLYALDAFTGALRWRTPLAVWRSSPTIAGDLVVVGSGNGNVYGVATQTGAVRWAFRTGGFVNSSPAVRDGVVYIGSDDGNVYALDLRTGRRRWATQVLPAVDDIVWSSPAVARGVVYVASSQAMVALRARDGRVLWTDPSAGTYASPAVSGGRLYVHAGRIAAYAPALA